MATLYTRTIGSVTYEGETITLKMVCTYTQTTYDNASNVSIYVRVESGDIFNKVESWQITGNGPTGSGGETSSSKATRNMTTKTKKISHLSNGAQTFSSGAKVTLNYMTGGGWASKSFTLSNVSYALPTINVYPSISFSPASPYMSSTVTMNITKPSTTAFTATGVKIVAEYDGTSVDIYEGTGASTSWAIPDLSATTPNSETKAIAIKVQSIRDGTYYAVNELTLNAQVPAAYVPSCAFGTITDNYNFSAFIAGYSLLTIPINSGTAGTGATIASYTIEVRDTDASGAIIYTATNTTTAATTSFTMTSAILSTTTYIKAIITDSRGRTGTITTTVSAAAYTQPQILLSAVRCDSGGTPDPVVAYVKIVCSWSITQIGTDNNLAERVRIYKSTDGSTFTQIDARYVAAGTYSETYYIIEALATNTQGYFYAQTRDNVSPRVRSSTKIMPRAIIPLSLYDDGSTVGVTMGEAATEDGFNCKMDANFLVNGAMGGVLVDYVIEQGTDGDWTYRRWANGKSECWLVTEHTANSWTSWTTGLYYNGNFTTPSYPTWNGNDLFVAIPSVVVGLQKKTSDGNGLKVLATSTTASKTQYGSVRIIGANTKTETFYISIYAVGRWK